MDNNEKGIVLIAGMHSTYLNYALGLIATIRSKEKDLPIVLYVTEGLATPEKSRVLNSFFNTEVKTLPAEHYLIDGVPSFMKVKSALYELSPFRRTIYLDVDIAMLPRKKMADLFESLKGKPFEMIDEGYFDITDAEMKTSGFYTFWADKWDIIEQFPKLKETGYLNQLRSEFIYFEKRAKVKKLFELVSQIYDDPKARPTKLGGSLPDEYAFNVATSLMKIRPTIGEGPIYWDFKRAARKIPVIDEFQVMEKYYGFSIGGNRTTEWQRRFYLQMVKGSMIKLGVPHMAFQLIDKKDISQLNRKTL